MSIRHLSRTTNYFTFLQYQFTNHFFYIIDLLPADARKRIIEILGETIATFKGYEKQWVENELVNGNNPDSAITVMVLRMLISLETSWQKAEKELLVMEQEFRKLMLVKEKPLVRRKN